MGKAQAAQLRQLTGFTFQRHPSINWPEERLQAIEKYQQVRAGALWNNPDNLVFTNAMGGHLVPQTAYKHFKRIVKALGCPDLRFHDLRHSYAVNALQAGDNIKDVQDALGHHTAAFTMDAYAHITEQMKQASADRMERFIQAVAQ